MFIITRGLLSGLLITQGYSSASITIPMIATTYTLTLSSPTGTSGTPVNLIVSPNGNYAGTIVVNLQGALTTTLTFDFDGDSTIRSQKVTPLFPGNVTFSSISNLIDPAPITYTVSGVDSAVTPVINPTVLPVPIITFMVNLNSSAIINDYQSQFRTIAIPGVGTLTQNTTFVMYGLQANYVQKTYSSGIIGDYTSYPLMVISYSN